MRLARLAAASCALVAATASRSQMEAPAPGAAPPPDGGVVWPRVVQPQPLYVELPQHAAARQADPQDASLPPPLMLFGDVMLTGSCLKMVGFNAAAAGPSFEHVFARVAGGALAEHLTLAVPSAGVADARLQSVHVGDGAEVPVLGVFCHPALEDVVDEVEVNVRWTAPVPPPPAEGGSLPPPPPTAGGARVGSVRVLRTVPDVDPAEPLEGGDRGAPVVVVCAHFALDAATGTGWSSYWTRGLGASRVVLYFNGRFDALEEGEMKTVRELLAANPNVTLVEWPFPYAFRAEGDVNGTDAAGLLWAAPPMAATHCAHAFGAAADVLLFADSKDYAVVPAAAAAGGAPALPRLFASLREARGAFDVATLRTHWAAATPSAHVLAGAEMGLDEETAERVRGDLISAAYLRAVPLLRTPAANPGQGKFALTRAAATSGRLGLVCVHGPCAGGGSDGLVTVALGPGEAYNLRLASAGAPLALGGNRTAAAALVRGATELDEGFRAHLRAAAAGAGLLPPAPAGPTPTAAAATCAPTAGLGSVPPPVARLHAELTKSQLHPDCTHDARRFLVFSYGAEQAVNGFAAMFQAYAGALALGHATGRTLVELLPPPLVPAGAGGAPNASGCPYSSRQSAVDAWEANDPWRRAPPHACRGAKMGCFFAPHAGCAATGATAGALPRFDFAAELRRLGRSGSPPHRKLPGGGGDGNSGGAGEAVGGGSLPAPRASKKKLGAAGARAVVVDSIAAVRPALLAATRGDFAPDWFRSAAAEWACGPCAPAGWAAVHGGAPGCGPADAAALEDHCAAYCPAGPDRAWRALWFPALEAWLFRPGAAIANATAAAVAKLTAPLGGAGDLAGGGEGPREGDGVVAVGAAGETTAAATGGGGWRRRHVAIGVHYRAGDAAGLVWRSHAPLGAYVQAARALVAGLDARERSLVGGLGSPADAAALRAANDTAVHVSLLVATDSTAGREGARALVWDSMAGRDAPLWDAGTNRTPAFAAAAAAIAAAGGGAGDDKQTQAQTQHGTARFTAANVTSAEPLLSALDAEAHALVEGDPRARDVVAVLRDKLRARLTPRQGGLSFHRLVTTDARLLTRPPAPPRPAANATPADARNATGGEGEHSTAPAGAGVAGGGDLTVHMESHILDVLRDARPRIQLASDGDGADDDVYPSKDADHLRLVRLLPEAFASWPGRLSEEADPPGEAEAAQAAASADVAALTAGVIGDVWALSHANYLLGSCLSQVSRLAYELALAAGRARAPPVGLDARLCRTFPMPAPYAVMADWRDSHDVWVGGDE